jgi:hypothetical protein
MTSAPAQVAWMAARPTHAAEFPRPSLCRPSGALQKGGSKPGAHAPGYTLSPLCG